MDNMADFLKTSFAVLVFIIGLTLSLSMVSNISTTSRAILKNSNKNTYFRTMTKSETAESRKVKNETIISMINRIERESFCVKVIDGDKIWFFDIENSKKIEGITETEMSLDELINDYISETMDETATYEEKFTEQVYEGQYKTADDGTVLVIRQGAAKLHITYTKDI